MRVQGLPYPLSWPFRRLDTRYPHEYSGTSGTIIRLVRLGDWHYNAIGLFAIRAEA